MLPLLKNRQQSRQHVLCTVAGVTLFVTLTVAIVSYSGTMSSTHRGLPEEDDNTNVTNLGNYNWVCPWKVAPFNCGKTNEVTVTEGEPLMKCQHCEQYRIFGNDILKAQNDVSDRIVIFMRELNKNNVPVPEFTKVDRIYCDAVDKAESDYNNKKGWFSRLTGQKKKAANQLNNIIIESGKQLDKAVWQILEKDDKLNLVTKFKTWHIGYMENQKWLCKRSEKVSCKVYGSGALVGCGYKTSIKYDTCGTLHKCRYGKSSMGWRCRTCTTTDRKWWTDSGDNLPGITMVYNTSNKCKECGSMRIKWMAV